MEGQGQRRGLRERYAARQTNNLAGDIERLKGSLETFAIQAGSGGNGGLRALTKGLNDVVDQFVGLPPAVGSAVTILAGLGGGAALGLAAWVKLRKGIADAAEQLAATGPAGEKAAGALGKVTSVAGKATVVFAALEAVQIVADHFGAAAINVDQLTSSLTNFANTGKTAGTLNDTFGVGLADLGKNAQTAEAATHGFWGGLNDLTTSIPGRTRRGRHPERVNLRAVVQQGQGQHVRPERRPGQLHDHHRVTPRSRVTCGTRSSPSPGSTPSSWPACCPTRTRSSPSSTPRPSRARAR
jgi:hypothetical protein